MNRSGLFILIMLVTIGTGWTASAQSVLATSGSGAKNGGVSLSQTIGELAIITFFSGDYALTQGFHQPGYTGTQVPVRSEAPFTVSIGPNPAQEYVEIRIKEDFTGIWLVELADIQGIRLYRKEGNSPVMRISLVSFSAGMYHIRVSEKVSGSCKTYKLIHY